MNLNLKPKCTGSQGLRCSSLDRSYSSNSHWLSEWHSLGQLSWILGSLLTHKELASTQTVITETFASQLLFIYYLLPKDHSSSVQDNSQNIANFVPNLAHCSNSQGKGYTQGRSDVCQQRSMYWMWPGRMYAQANGKCFLQPRACQRELDEFPTACLTQELQDNRAKWVEHGTICTSRYLLCSSVVEVSERWSTKW